MKNQNLRQDRNGGLKRLQKRKKLHQLTLQFVHKEMQEQFTIERAPTKQMLISIVFAFQAVLNGIFLIEHAVGGDNHKKEGMNDLDGDKHNNHLYDDSNFQTYIYSISCGIFGVLFICNFFCRQENSTRNLKRLTSDDKNDQKSTQQQQQQQSLPASYKSMAAENHLNDNNIKINSGANDLNANNSSSNQPNSNSNNNPLSISPTPNSNLIQQEPTVSSQNVSNNTSGVSSSNPANKTSSFSGDKANRRTRLLTIFFLNKFLHNIHYIIQTFLPILCFIVLLSYELTLGIGGKFYYFRRADFTLVQVFLSVSSLDSWPQQLILTVVSISLQFKTLSNSLGLIIILPAFLTILYVQERRKKLLFYDYFYLQKTLAAQQKLLDHTLPCSVIVLSSKDEDSQYGSFLRLNSNKNIKDSNTKNNNNNTYGNGNNSNSNNLNNSSLRRNSSQTKKSYVSQFSKQPQMPSVSGFNRQTSILKGINSKQKSLNYITYNNSNNMPKSPCLKRNTLIVTNSEINNNNINLLPDSERSALKETPLIKSTIVPDPACFNNIVRSTFLDPKEMKQPISSNNNNMDASPVGDINQATTQSVLPNTLPFSCFNQYIDQQRNEQKAESSRKNKEAKLSQQQQLKPIGEIELIENNIFDTFTQQQQNFTPTNATTPKPVVPFVQFASASMSFQAPQLELNLPCTCASPKENGKHVERKQCNCNHINNNNGLANTIQTPLFQQHQNSSLPSLFQQKYSITFSKQDSNPKDIGNSNSNNNSGNDNNKDQFQSQAKQPPEKSTTGQQVSFMEQQQQQSSQQNMNVMLTSSQRRDMSGIAGQSLGDSNKENNNGQSNRDIQYQHPSYSPSERNQTVEETNMNNNNQLKVNFVNSTCLHSFAIQRDETSRRSRPYEGQQLRTEFFNEAQPLQDEVFQLLSQIEVKTTELLDLPCKNNSFTPLSSPFELLDTTQRHNSNNNHNSNNGTNNSKRKLISASLLDVVQQKYSLFHKKYFSQISSKEVNESSNDELADNGINNLNLKQQQKSNDLSFEEVCRSLDLEKEDVFVNCVYRSGQAEKMLDIHIIEFQWIDEPAIMVVMTDVSQKVRARRLQDLDSYKNELLATVTHDLKTPLNGMLSILEVALELPDIKEIKNFITIVQKNGTLLNFLIMDILDYSAMLKGELRLILSRFDINDILKDINDLIGFQAQQKKLKFTIQNNLPESDCMLDNDSRRVKQILLNLTSNALKFTFSGEIAIIVEKDEFSSNIVRITVSDTGVGIPDSLKPKLFKLYGTFDHNNGSNKHGVGLGLVITKKLASQVGPKDTLKLESIEKVGTSFSFSVYKSLKHVFASSGGGGGMRGSGMESPGNHQNYCNNNSLSPIGQHNNNISNTLNRTQLPLTTPRNNNLEISTGQIMRFDDTSSYAKSPVAVDTQSNFYNNNTQEQCETDGPFLSQRVIHLHTPTPFFMGGKGQIQKYSQFQQYQSTPTQTTNNQFGRTTPDSSEIIQGTTLHKLSMSKGLDEERTTGTQRYCASFEGKGNTMKIPGIFCNLDSRRDTPDIHNILMDQSSEIIEIQEPSAYVPRNCQDVSNIHHLSQLNMASNNNSHVNVKDTGNYNNKIAQESNEDRLSCSISNIEITTGNDIDQNNNQQKHSNNNRQDIYELPINQIVHANNNNSFNCNITNTTSNNDPSYIPRISQNIPQDTGNDTDSNNNNNNNNNNNYSSSKDSNDNEEDDNVDANSLHNYFTNNNNFQFNGQQPPLIANTINKYGNSLSFSQKILNNHQAQFQAQQLLQAEADNNNHSNMASSMQGSQMLAENNKDNQPQVSSLFQANNSNSGSSGGNNNNNNQSLEMAATASNLPPPSTNLRILIVDDTYFNIVALKMLLKQLKHTDVQEAYNGQQALDLLYKSKEQQLSLPEGSQLQLQTTQLIFMDINMPIMDGLECTRVIRSDPFFNSTKIVAVTAYSSAAEGQKCFDAGMDAHLCKPISKTDCQAVINSLFQQP